MNKLLLSMGMSLLLMSCTDNENPLLRESSAPFGAPEFDKIKNEHYLPAFEASIAEGKKEIDAIVANPEAPTFENTIEAMENSGKTLDRVAGIFFNLMEAHTNDELQGIAEKVSPLLTEYSMYVSLNNPLFQRVKQVYENEINGQNLNAEQKKLLDDVYKGFVRGGANLDDEDKKLYSAWSEELSLATLTFSKNVLAATNAYYLPVTDSADLAGLPEYVKTMAEETAQERGLEGWVFTLDYPSYGPFMKYSSNRELRRQMWTAYNSRAIGGEYDNTEIVKKIVDLRIKIANILGYETYADYALEIRMAKSRKTVEDFIMNLLEPSIAFAKRDVKEVTDYARSKGFDEDLMPWDFSYWSEALQKEKYSINEEQLKPYFKLEDCIDAVFGLATRLYGVTFHELNNVPVYQEDVKVYQVKDADGTHLSLLYADFFPRASKRGGAWMTSFREQSVRNGVEYRPFVNIVMNFTKPTADAPSLITHGELTTFLHEFGHALHGMLAQGHYASLTGTSVPRDFVELPSQLMENWAYEPDYLNTFAKHYQTGEPIPAELIEKIVAAKNFLAGYGQVRQLLFGYIDMAWHTLTELPSEGVLEFEQKTLAPYSVLPAVDGTASSPSFSHIFAGGYSAGYYSYKWAEVLEADAFSFFKEEGIFNTDVSGAFRREILEKGGSEDADVIYRNFRGHDPQPEALMQKLGLVGLVK